MFSSSFTAWNCCNKRILRCHCCVVKALNEVKMLSIRSLQLCFYVSILQAEEPFFFYSSCHNNTVWEFHGVANKLKDWLHSVEPRYEVTEKFPLSRALFNEDPYFISASPLSGITWKV